MKIEAVFYDQDNTIAEMSKELSGKYSGHLKSYYAKNPEEEKEILKKLHTKGFFKNFLTIGDAVKVLKKINKKYNLFILSQPMINNYCIDEKNSWLNRHMEFIPRHKRMFTFDKYLLANKNRILVDDNIKHLTEWQKNGGIAICFERGYNKNWNGLKIKKHYEIFELLEKIERNEI